MVFATAQLVSGAHLKTQTLQEWDEYVAAAESRSQQRIQNKPGFLIISELPEMRSHVNGGGVSVFPVNSDGTVRIAGGQIHHWIGAILVPNVRISDLLRITRNYASYPRFYGPNVIAAKPLSTTEAEDRFSLRLLNRALVAGTALDAEYACSFRQMDAEHAVTTTRSLQIREVEHFGLPEEKELPPGEGKGYLWRIYSMVRLQQSERGVIVEMETIALSRSVPVSIRWLADPVIRRVSKDALTKALTQTKEAALLDGNGSGQVLAFDNRLPHRPR